MTTAQEPPLIVEGIRLVEALVEIRDRRVAGEGEDRVARATTAWAEMRRVWWRRVEDAHRGGRKQGFVLLAERLHLEPPEIDLLLVLLAGQIDPELAPRMAGPQRQALTTGLTLEVVLGLLFATSAERYAGRSMLSHTGRLVQQGLVSLHPLGHALSGTDVEVRPTETLTNFILGRPLASGPPSRTASSRGSRRRHDASGLRRGRDALHDNTASAGHGRLEKTGLLHRARRSAAETFDVSAGPSARWSSHRPHQSGWWWARARATTHMPS